jgi:hypothetical protein
MTYFNASWRRRFDGLWPIWAVGARRIVLVLATLAGGLGLVLISARPVLATYSFPENQIAQQAESYPDGYSGGQCRVWAGNVVNQVLAANHTGAVVGGYGSPGGAYYGAYADAGGVLVDTAAGQPGDLVQFINAAQKNSDNPSGFLHTAIIVATTSTPDTYVLRDSNWNWSGKVSQHTLNIASWARSNGVSAYVWRFGTIAAPIAARYEIAFQANTGSLWTVGGDPHGSWGAGMMAGTSPAITALPSGGYQVAFQANTGHLWTVGAQGSGDLGYGMMSGTSPAIAPVSGGYEIAFQANTGHLWSAGALGTGDDGYGMLGSTSPSTVGI